MVRLVVCGDRNWENAAMIEQVLACFIGSTKVSHGACRGADQIAAETATDMGMWVQQYPADWEKHGKAAGPIRNRQMLETEMPDMVLAFHSNLAESKGTRDTISVARKLGIPVALFE